MTSYEQEAFSRIWGNVHRPERGCWTFRQKRATHQVNAGTDPETGEMRHQQAHRFVFTVMYGGPLPRGMVVTQLCGNRDCIKPGHLAGTTRPRLHQMKDSKRRLRVVR